MPAAKKQNQTDIPEARSPLDIGKRLPFDHIIEKHQQQYDFCVINNARGSIQRHLARGWKVWDQDKLYDDEFTKKTEAGKTDDGYASVPCGIAGDGKPTNAYLLYAPKGLAQKIVDARHAENRERKRAYGSAVDNRVGVQGVDTYTPDGFGDGMKVLPNTMGQPNT